MKCSNCGLRLSDKPTMHKLVIPIPDNYGIKKYTKDQKRLHKEIKELLQDKYLNMPADDCMIVFSRVYGDYLIGLEKLE